MYYYFIHSVLPYYLWEFKKFKFVVNYKIKLKLVSL